MYQSILRWLRLIDKNVLKSDDSLNSNQVVALPKNSVLLSTIFYLFVISVIFSPTTAIAQTAGGVTCAPHYSMYDYYDGAGTLYLSQWEIDGYTCETATSPGGSDTSFSSDREVSNVSSDAIASVATNQIEPCSDGQQTTSRPVVISNGTKFIPESDFNVGAVMPLGINRTYVSSSTQGGVFGNNWSSTLDYGLRRKYELETCETKLSGNTTCANNGIPLELSVKRPGGGYVVFTKDSNDVWHSDPRFAMQLLNNQWVMTKADGGVEIYNLAGQPLTVRDARNIGWTFNYDGQGGLMSVLHTDGRSIGVTWLNNKINTVTAPGGSVYAYSYNANGYLSGVTFPAGLGTRTYHYEQTGQPSAVTGISINGVRYTRYAYNANGTVNYSGLEGGADRSTFIYSGTYTDVTNSLGNTKRYNLVDLNGSKVISSIEGTASTACPSGMSNTTFGADNKVSSESDEQGNKSEFTYSQVFKNINQSITGIASDGDRSKQQITQLVWDSTEQQILGIKTFGSTTSDLINEVIYEYYPVSDASNRGQLIKSVTEIDRASTTVPSPSRQTTYDYTVHPNNNIAQMRIDGPVIGNADTTVYDYDTFGNLTKLTDSAGNFVTYSNYTALGKPGRTISENGVVVDILYDEKGRVTKRTLYGSAANIIVDYQYDALDNLTRVSDNAGDWVEYKYDALGKLLSVNKQGDGVGPFLIESTNKIEYTYNLYNQIIAERIKAYTTKMTFVNVGGEPTEVPVTTIKESQTSFTDYDAAGLMLANRGNQGQNIRYFYDEAGRLASQTNSLNEVTSYDYDTHGRLASSLAPDNGLTQIEYNALDLVSKVTDPRGKITQYDYNGFGELLQVISPDSGASTLIYDGAGRVSEKRTDDNRVATYTYDLLGRVVTLTETWPQSNPEYQNLLPTVKTFTYDTCLNGKGRLCSMVDPSGSTTYEYTPLGQYSKQTSVINTSASTSNTYVLIWTYDNFARLSQFTYPNGNAVRYTYDVKHRVSKIESRIGASGTWAIAASTFVYQPFGPITSFKNANGLYRVKNFDSSGRVTSIENGSGVQSLSYAYNVNNLITGITNNVQSSSSQSYGYDVNSRLVTANGGVAGSQSLLYDLNGNRTSHTWSSATDIYDNSAIGNALNSISGTRTRVFTYDSVGNLIEDSQNGVASKFSYDASNRLRSLERTNPVNVCRPNGQCFNLIAGFWSYTYNAQNQRVSKNASLNATSGVVSRRHYIYNPNGQMIAEANGDTGIVDASYLWIGSEPLAIIKGTNLYSIHSDHLGRPEKVTNSAKTIVWKAENYAFDRKVTLDNIGGLNIGFPGQYYDQESDTFYNYFRTYDGSLGRYQQSDPIGLNGGLNTFAYAGSSPAVLFDSLGLVPQDSITMKIEAYIAQGDIAGLNTLFEAGALNPAQSQLARAGIQRLSMTAEQMIGREVKGSVMRVFPGELRKKTFAEILKGARQGDKACQTARKLLTDLRFQK